MSNAFAHRISAETPQLYHADGRPVSAGDAVTSFRGESFVVSGWPNNGHNRVWVMTADHDENEQSTEYFPSVFNLVWGPLVTGNIPAAPVEPLPAREPAYYLLATRDENRFSVQFGDFIKSLVVAERRDYIDGSQGYKSADVVVIKAASALQSDCDAAVAELNATLPYTPPEAYDALKSYAAEYGRKWKDALALDWYRARAIGERGTVLHGLRNHPRFGAEGLIKFRF
jgi:hypothetical protein